jgi:hypothetical protein
LFHVPEGNNKYTPPGTHFGTLHALFLVMYCFFFGCNIELVQATQHWPADKYNEIY